MKAGAPCTFCTHGHKEVFAEEDAYAVTVVSLYVWLKYKHPSVSALRNHFLSSGQCLQAHHNM